MAAELRRRAERAAAKETWRTKATKLPWHRDRAAICWLRHADVYKLAYQVQLVNTGTLGTAVAVFHRRQRLCVCLGAWISDIVVTQRRGQGLKQVQLLEKSRPVATSTNLLVLDQQWKGLLASGKSSRLCLWDSDAETALPVGSGC